MTPADPMDNPAPLVAVEGISKRFTGTQALDDVSFRLAEGEVHALIGENGAGKSTLIKILGGVHAPDSGTLSIAGAPVALASPRAALNAGIVVIPQEMSVVPAQSVAENVMMGHVPTRRALGVLPGVDRRGLRARTAALLARLNLEVDPDLAVGRLPFAERQLVMIARALGRDARILILDEPTAALEARDWMWSGLREGGAAVMRGLPLSEYVAQMYCNANDSAKGRQIGAGVK